MTDWQKNEISRVDPATSGPGTGADTLSKIVMRSDDFGEVHCEGVRLAYTQYDESLDGKTPTQMHICQEDAINAYAYPDLSKISCEDLDPFVSEKMITFGGHILLHELM